MTSAEKVKRWRMKHPEHVVEYQRRWVEKNREHYREYQREYQRAYRAKKKLEKETQA